MYWCLYFLPNPSAYVTHWNLCVFDSRNSAKYPSGYLSRVVGDGISCWCYVSLSLSTFHPSIHDRQPNRRPDHISIIKNLISCILWNKFGEIWIAKVYCDLWITLFIDINFNALCIRPTEFCIIKHALAAENITACICLVLRKNYVFLSESCHRVIFVLLWRCVFGVQQNRLLNILFQLRFKMRVDKIANPPCVDLNLSPT
jgi:hypothetical protein